ncbi:PUA domain protein [Methanobacterium aggregans]|nr:PUA domain protein [Methanobacterium aggregans]
MKIRKRYYLKKKKLKEVQEKLGVYSELIGSKSKVEIIETDLPDILLVDGEPLVMMLDGAPLPTIKGALKMDITSSYVVVDMGAVKFVAKGADIMSPGIVDADPSIEEGDLVVILEETHKKPLAVGRSLISGPEMVENSEGKAVKSLHYVGDEIWNLEI